MLMGLVRFEKLGVLGLGTPSELAPQLNLR